MHKENCLKPQKPIHALLCSILGSTNNKYCCSLLCTIGLYTGAFVLEGGDSEHKSPGAPAVAWLCEIKQNRIQEAVHAGKRPGALVYD